jgi:hypothetical protein
MKYDITKGFLEEEYIVNGKSHRQIALIVGCHHSRIQSLCKKYNIKARTISDARTGRPHIRKGRTQSEETKRKISLAKKGKPSHNKGISLSDDRKKQIGDFHRGKTISKKQRELFSKIFKGSGNPNWKGGISTEASLVRTSEKYQQWRLDILNRDKWTCLKCNNGKGKNLNAHHIKSFKYFPDFRFDINNGITLCRECHFSLHAANRNMVYLTV